MKRLQGIALVSHLRKQAREKARSANLAKKRGALEKMQSVYQAHKNVTRLERIGQRMQAYAGIVRSSLTIAFYGVPIVVLTACAIKVVFWILF